MLHSLAEFNHNQPVYSVSEIAQAIKRTVEDRFGVVRLRGEISGFKLHSSGHAYYCLKDDNAVIDAVCWRGTIGRLRFKPEDGLEVVCTGKITTYPGRSKYQIVIDHMEPAGAGALMALLEKRRKQLEAEGLFAPERKKPLPFLPKIVGVITSPTGAVIRDILHRIADRFPLHVIVWPVAVQGEAAASQVAEAITGFNSLNPESRIPVPDVLIVARGGGSIEDLWAFNEEIVVRAAANSCIPLISAVGHETDTTLIDYASDRRAPTPTAAAEMAVPVREELWLTCKQLDARLNAAQQRLLAQRQDMLQALGRGLPKPMQLLQTTTQRLDDWGERLLAALPSALTRKEQALLLQAARLKPQLLLADIRRASEGLIAWRERLNAALPMHLYKHEQQLALATAGLRPTRLADDIAQLYNRLEELQARLHTAWQRQHATRQDTLRHCERQMENLNYQRVLERGFALVKDAQGHLITSAAQAQAQAQLQVIFGDGAVVATPQAAAGS